eukprot:4868959-Prymnesium_polylepis.2
MSGVLVRDQETFRNSRSNLTCEMWGFRAHMSHSVAGILANAIARFFLKLETLWRLGGGHGGLAK